ncbi:MAG TPA: OmpA family protein [Longimicrobiales bacterium]
MGSTPRKVTMLVFTGLLLGGCATKGALRRAVTDQQAALQSEKAERMAADEKMGQDITQLRTDLTALRTEFGAKITAMQEGLKFDVPVHFGFDSADLRPEDTAVLDRFASVASKYYPGVAVTVEGFADPAGTVRYNQSLSMRRAQAVQTYLQGKQLANVRPVGYGKTRLVVPGAAKDAPGAELNRRVVFVIETPAAASAVAALDN